MGHSHCKALTKMDVIFYLPDSFVFLWQYQDKESCSSRPDLFGDMDDAPNGEGSTWAEPWSLLKILRGHLQVFFKLFGLLSS